MARARPCRARQCSAARAGRRRVRQSRSLATAAALKRGAAPALWGRPRAACARVCREKERTHASPRRREALRSRDRPT
eukprot:258818-Prymnesium_polylepis.1